MRLITLLITVVALAIAAPAIADKGGTPHGGSGGGGGGGGNATATPTPTPDSTAPTSSDPSISIATVDGVTMAASTRPEPAHLDNVTFNTTSGSLAGWEYPMVSLSCYQNNGLVYVQLNHPDATFTVGGGSSQWTAGDATCHASLYAYGWKAGQESTRLLAATYDWTVTW
jgi:hypothetical protein